MRVHLYTPRMRTLFLRPALAFSLVLLPLSAQATYWIPGVPHASGSTLHVQRVVIRRTSMQNNPRDPAVTRNDRRLLDLKAIGTAVFTYKTDHGFVIPKGMIPLADTEICKTGVTDCKGFVDLKLLAPYLPVLPTDPQNPASKGTGYLIREDWTGRVYFTAPKAELGWSIRHQR
jgi:hypothetical protein